MAMSAAPAGGTVGGGGGTLGQIVYKFKADTADFDKGTAKMAQEMQSVDKAVTANELAVNKNFGVWNRLVGVFRMLMKIRLAIFIASLSTAMAVLLVRTGAAGAAFVSMGRAFFSGITALERWTRGIPVLHLLFQTLVRDSLSLVVRFGFLLSALVRLTRGVPILGTALANLQNRLAANNELFTYTAMHFIPLQQQFPLLGKAVDWFRTRWVAMVAVVVASKLWAALKTGWLIFSKLLDIFESTELGALLLDTRFAHLARTLLLAGAATKALGLALSPALPGVGGVIAATGGVLLGLVAAAHAAVIGIGALAQRIGRDLFESTKRWVDVAIQAEKLTFGLSVALQNFSRLTGDTTLNVESLSKRIFELAQQTGIDVFAMKSAVIQMLDLGNVTGLTGQHIDTLIKRMADFAAVTGEDFVNTIYGLDQALRGFPRVLQSMGLRVDEAGAKQTEFAKSLRKSWGEMTRLERATAMTQTIMEQTESFAGKSLAAAKETIAGALQRMQGQLLNLHRVLGEGAQTAWRFYYKSITFVVHALNQLPEVALRAAGTLKALAGQMLFLTGITLKYSTVGSALFFLYQALNLVMAKNIGGVAKFVTTLTSSEKPIRSMTGAFRALVSTTASGLFVRSIRNWQDFLRARYVYAYSEYIALLGQRFRMARAQFALTGFQMGKLTSAFNAAGIVAKKNEVTFARWQSVATGFLGPFSRVVFLLARLAILVGPVVHVLSKFWEMSNRNGEVTRGWARALEDLNRKLRSFQGAAKLDKEVYQISFAQIGANAKYLVAAMETVNKKLRETTSLTEGQIKAMKFEDKLRKLNLGLQDVLVGGSEEMVRKIDISFEGLMELVERLQARLNISIGWLKMILVDGSKWIYMKLIEFGTRLVAWFAEHVDLPIRNMFRRMFRLPELDTTDFLEQTKKNVDIMKTASEEVAQSSAKTRLEITTQHLRMLGLINEKQKNEMLEQSEFINKIWEKTHAKQARGSDIVRKTLEQNIAAQKEFLGTLVTTTQVSDKYYHTVQEGVKLNEKQLDAYNKLIALERELAKWKEEQGASDIDIDIADIEALEESKGLARLRKLRELNQLSREEEKHYLEKFIEVAVKLKGNINDDIVLELRKELLRVTKELYEEEEKRIDTQVKALAARGGSEIAQEQLRLQLTRQHLATLQQELALAEEAQRISETPEGTKTALSLDIEKLQVGEAAFSTLLGMFDEAPRKLKATKQELDSLVGSLLQLKGAAGKEAGLTFSEEQLKTLEGFIGRAERLRQTRSLEFALSTEAGKFEDLGKQVVYLRTRQEVEQSLVRLKEEEAGLADKLKRSEGERARIQKEGVYRTAGATGDLARLVETDTTAMEKNEKILKRGLLERQRGIQVAKNQLGIMDDERKLQGEVVNLLGKTNVERAKERLTILRSQITAKQASLAQAMGAQTREEIQDRIDEKMEKEYEIQVKLTELEKKRIASSYSLLENKEEALKLEEKHMKALLAGTGFLGEKGELKLVIKTEGDVEALLNAGITQEQIDAIKRLQEIAQAFYDMREAREIEYAKTVGDWEALRNAEIQKEFDERAQLLTSWAGLYALVEEMNTRKTISEAEKRVADLERLYELEPIKTPEMEGKLLEAKEEVAHRQRMAAARAAENEFQAWYANLVKEAATIGVTLDPNPDNPMHFYDYRAAQKAGAKPDTTGHMPSEFKREGHPQEIVEGVNVRTGMRATEEDVESNRIAYEKVKNFVEQNQAEITQIQGRAQQERLDEAKSVAIKEQNIWRATTEAQLERDRQTAELRKDIFGTMYAELQETALKYADAVKAGLLGREEGERLLAQKLQEIWFQYYNVRAQLDDAYNKMQQTNSVEEYRREWERAQTLIESDDNLNEIRRDNMTQAIRMYEEAYVQAHKDITLRAFEGVMTAMDMATDALAESIEILLGKAGSLKEVLKGLFGNWRALFARFVADLIMDQLKALIAAKLSALVMKKIAGAITKAWVPAAAAASTATFGAAAFVGGAALTTVLNSMMKLFMAAGGSGESGGGGAVGGLAGAIGGLGGAGESFQPAAKGGVITKRSVVEVAEAGEAEAIIPMSRLEPLINLLSKLSPAAARSSSKERVESIFGLGDKAFQLPGMLRDASKTLDTERDASRTSFRRTLAPLEALASRAVEFRRASPAELRPVSVAGQTIVREREIERTSRTLREQAVLGNQAHIDYRHYGDIRTEADLNALMDRFSRVVRDAMAER